MKCKLSIFLFGALLLGLALIGLDKSPASQAAGQPNRKIVVFDTTILNDKAQESLLAKFGSVKVKDLKLINGKAVLLPPVAEAALARQAGVLRIDDDAEVFALAKPAPSQPPQTLPWGIKKIKADLAWPLTTGDPVKVAVVDTGIDLAHPDLAGNLKGGYNAIYPDKSANDDNGHGTHVAGIIAALNNSVGVVGVGPQIDLYAIKVLNRNGSGYVSDIIEGLDWAIANGVQVVNMSLGTSSDIQSFHDALSRAYQAGIVLVAAGGNNYGGKVDFPGAYPEVIAVSATDSSDKIASFSSVGPEIDLAAPGASVFSTYKGSIYATLSGTSMASPHVAGSAALVLTAPVGSYDLNSNGRWDPDEVKNKLQATATDLGQAGPDNFYGAGLVDALKAVSQ